MPEPVQSELVHDGRLITVEALRFTDPGGRDVQRDVVRHPGAVVIVPVLDDGRLVLIRNYRITIDERLWECPAGTLEPGEEPQRAAARELQEETGYRPATVRRLCRFYTTPGFCDELIHVFVAEGLTMLEQNLDPGEDIEVSVLSVDEVISMIADGRLRDGKTMAAVLLWLRERDGR